MSRPGSASLLITRVTALSLTVLTGFSGLVYEVTWQKCLATLLGSHSEAASTVLGIYLGGLALGYAIFGRVTARLVRDGAGRASRLLVAYGVVEATIGVWALAFPAVFQGVQSLSLALPHMDQGVSFAIDVVLTALLIGPPTVLMGGTIPILTQALARSLEDSGRVHAMVYAFNTAGAFLGALAAGFVLIAWLGLNGVLYAMGVVNLVAGSVFLLLGLFGRGGAGAPPPSAASPRVAGFGRYAAIACLLGFAMMSTQTVMIRLGGLALGSSHFTFSMVVAVFVLCIALGGFVVSALSRTRPIHLHVAVWSLAALLTLLYLQLDDAPYYARIIRSVFRDDDVAFYPFFGATFLALLAVLGLPVAISGATLPLLFGHLRTEIGELGTLAGRLYSWNTVGNLAGALLGGYALLFWLDLHAVYRLGVAAVLAAAGLLAWSLIPRPPLRTAAVGAAAVALALLALLPAWSPAQLSAGTFRRTEPIGQFNGPDAFFRIYELGATIDFYDDDPTHSIAVKSIVKNGRPARAIYNNGKSDGSLAGDYPTMSLVGLIPCVLQEACRSAFVIGYGTGVTAGELTALDSVERVQVAEISRGVIEAAPLFEHGNRGPMRSGKLELIRSDAYRALLRSEERFDLIASEPSNPWMSGVEMLYSREFLTAARDRLEPGGIYAQWIHLYETDRTTVELVLRTYQSVFDHVAVWFTMGTDVLLLGFRDEPEIDLAALERRFEARDMRKGMRRSGVESLVQLLTHELIPDGTLHALHADGELHTLLHPVLSHHAARAFFRDQRTALPAMVFPVLDAPGAAEPLLTRWAVSHGGTLDDDTWSAIAQEMCEFSHLCPTLVVRWGLEHPDSTVRAELLAWMRRAPRWSEQTSEETLDRIRRLYEGSASLPLSLSPADAAAWTATYADHYHAAFPFPRESLREIWRRCRGRCQAGREAAEARVGAF